MDFDIVIIGGGLAGISAAKAIIRSSNLSVAIFEGNGIGSNNPTPLTFYDVIKDNDLLDCVKEKYSTFMFHNYSGSSVTYSLPYGALVALDYQKACKKIFNKITKGSNKIFFIDQFIRDINVFDDIVQSDLQNGNHVYSRLVIDASGKAQLAKSKFGQNHSPQYYSYVYGAFFSDVKRLDKDISCYLLPSKKFGSGGGWFYSINKNSASFGYAQITNSPDSDYKNIKNIFQNALNNFTPYSDYLRNAKIEYIEKGVIPISYIDTFIFDKIIIIGDAAGIATNWMCMGVEPALKYGSLAGFIAAESLTKNELKKLCSFQKQWEKENKITFDNMTKQVTTFWESDYYFWEWIIKNDLAYLTPKQMLCRMKNNDYLLKKHQIFIRALRYKIKCLSNKKTTLPKQIVIH